jgi:hypothetical protein
MIRAYPQKKWNDAQKARGLCILCAQRAVTASHCETHAHANRERARAYYRAGAGLPLDMPVTLTGRKRL